MGNANTTIIPNPTSTGGSTGTPYACEAVKQTSEQMRSRIMEFGYSLLKDNGEEWCKGKGIDFWNYGTGEGKGWATIVTDENNNKAMIWQNLTNLASSNRVDLIASFNAKIKGGELQVPVMTFKDEKNQPNIPGVDRIKNAKLGGGVDSFVGFTYSAACAVTEVDILTGEVKILSADIIYDMGWSMNPAIDIGQVEGAFIQGLGWLTCEELFWNNNGKLMTTGPSTYKIPGSRDMPNLLNVKLLDNSPNVEKTIFRSKAVGEPPLMLAISAWLAIRNAISNYRKDGILNLNARHNPFLQ